MKEDPSIIERGGKWMRNSISLKLFIISFLVLMLLIPSTMIKSIIYERQALQEQATTEVSSKWANSQLLTGPILTIPVVYEYEQKNTKNGVTTYEQVHVQEVFHLLPSALNINGTVTPKKLTRGLYEIVVYESESTVTGAFKLDINPKKSGLVSIKWEEAFLTIGISDLRGIQNEIIFNWGEIKLPIEPGSNITNLVQTGITAKLPNLEPLKNTTVPFSFNLNLQGSKALSFIPLGANTTVHLSSSWSSPSFDGSFLPDTRAISENGFEATWEILQLNRNFPQSWVGSSQKNNLDEAVFGVNFIVGVDDYQKSMRSAKYAIMTIVLTFLIFFLVEILYGRKIHPFQYILVGLSLSLFYVLLISISEHTSFNLAYLISALAVVIMISLYSLSVFDSKKHSLLLASTLVGIYSFLFVTLQLTDYALLMGSIGLTTILAVTMYFTRKVNWYNIKTNSSD